MSERSIGEPTLRVHILLFESDWAWLRRAYPDGIKRSSVIRGLLRDFRSKIDAKREQKHRTLTLKDIEDLIEDTNDGKPAAA